VEGVNTSFTHTTDWGVGQGEPGPMGRGRREQVAWLGLARGTGRQYSGRRCSGVDVRAQVIEADASAKPVVVYIYCGPVDCCYAVYCGIINKELILVYKGGFHRFHFYSGAC